ncbi:50S ribosomal protein L4 [Haloglomus irregulare]|jgi:large subunit ribosomal protein L4e|uniref:Large ribosomal subunit protein uL4 n=1 Tax=Haloglomus irregulare TaxID=2234134 RepID=A0A554NEY9_9EURY|nr:50S ribosomal protein L4 [Haloglomus irregulare]TSD15951.1 50S ribosomal protein L4 [Haloglomus irregulare]
MEATVRDLDGEDAGSVELPDVFGTVHRPDLIKRAVLAAQANRRQDYGTDEFAGLRTPAESPGSGRGMAHVPRQNGVAKRVPQTVGGRPAHPPKVEKDRTLDINDKERQFAVRSALAATTDAELVAERGHEFDEDVELPLVVSDEFEDLQKTQAALSTLEALGVADDVQRADDGRKIRSGKGTGRGRKYKRPKSVLVVTSEEPSRAARNLAGVDVATADEVNAEDLAPGAHPGRLTLFTESALAEVAGR